MCCSRRDFLKTTATMLLARTALAQATSGVKDRPVLVAIFQRGAADGLSMAPPFGDNAYYALRPQIAISAPRSSDDESAIDLDGFFGLHPSLRPLKAIYDRKELAVVHAVGSPSNTRSHFDAQDYMESGSPDAKSTRDGWLNRYLQMKEATASSPFRGVAFSPNMPRSLIGMAPAVAMTRIEDFDVRTGDKNIPEEFAAMWKNDAFQALRVLKQANPLQYRPDNQAVYPNSQLGNTLRQIAQLIKAQIGLEVAFADVGGWDTHANQGSSRGQLALRLDDFAKAIAAFHQDLGERMGNVVVLTMTEFGRAARQNGSGGTDHGHASALLISGGPVKGGRVYGEWPGLAEEHLYEGRDLALTTDFRTVFSEILSKHMGLVNAGRIFPGYRAQQSLGVV